MSGRDMLELRKYPDPVLSKRSRPVRTIDKEFVRLVDEMFETMYEGHGVGLAAPQVGKNLRVFVMNCRDGKDGELVLINPVIVEMSGEEIDEEGCLSVPGVRMKVARAEHVKVKAYTEKGEEIELEADGLEARAVQHELDHLDGRLFFQRLNEAARMTLKDRLRMLEKEYRGDDGRSDG